MLILVQVNHDGAREAMLRSVASLGHDVRPVKLPNLPGNGEIGVALVYDLDPWTSVAVEHLRSVRERHPTMPILIYPPQFLHTQIASLLLMCAEISGLTIVFQDPRNSTRSLAEAVTVALDSTASLTLERLVRLLLNEQQHGNARGYVLQILETLRRRGLGWRSPGVTMIAAEMKTHPRKLERELSNNGLPSPRLVLQHVLLLWVLAVGAFARLPFANAVAASGLNRKRMYRLRTSLLVGLDAGAPPDQLFDIAFLKFAEVCRIPRERAEETLRARAG